MSEKEKPTINPYIKRKKAHEPAAQTETVDPASKRPRKSSNRSSSQPAQPLDAYEVMREGSQQYEKKKKAEAEKKAALAAKKNAAAARSATVAARPSQARKASQNKAASQDDNSNELNDLGAPEEKPQWSKSAWVFLNSILETVKDSVWFEERGRHELKGEWPLIHFHPKIEASSDPITWIRALGNEKSLRDLSREDFALPNVMCWAPERRWPWLYEQDNFLPRCPWHCKSDCVERNSWTNYPRRCYEMRDNTALHTTKFKCQIREKANEHPYSFHSHAPAVMCQAPDFVQAYWREHGYRMTHRGAVRWTVLDEMRAMIANGSGASGFHRALIEQYKQAHANKSKMWRDFVNRRYHDQKIAADLSLVQKARALYFDFDDPGYDTRTPSFSFLLNLCIEEIESRVPYYCRKMQMVGGQNLSADHSHKVAKVVLIEGERGFMGIYTVMNEFGKVLGFWFVNGTQLLEVESCLRGIEKRYRLHKFDGPQFFTTDRCCDERSFLSGSANEEGKPIFTSFEKLYGISLDSDNPTTAAATQNGERNEAEDGTIEIVEVRKISLPFEPIAPQTLATAETTVGDIANLCIRNEWNVISLDCENTPNTNSGPHVVQIGLPDGRTYVFHVARYKEFPKNLRALIEDKSIIKVGHNISYEVRKFAEIGIRVTNYKDTGHMAFDRGIKDRRKPRLDELVESLFECKMDKNKEIQLSDWGRNNTPLNSMQLRYAAMDAYATISVYMKLDSMAYVDPSQVGPPQSRDLRPGTHVLLYTKNKNAVVASGTVVSDTPNDSFDVVRRSGYIEVQVSKESVRKPAAIVPKTPAKSFDQLLREVEDSTDSHEIAFVTVKWKVSNIRICSHSSLEPQEEVTVTFEMVAEAVPIENESDQFGKDFADDPDESIEAMLKELEDVLGSIDHEEGTESHHRGVMQDIEHIFLRFSRVLSKDHGAFGAFMARLSDAFFVPSQSDIAFIKTMLRKAGLSEDQIKSKPWNYYKRRVRRRVPPRKILEREFIRVVSLFAKVVDAKTGKPLFGPRAWSLYKSTLKHIRRGCLSDVEGLSYYVEIGEDSNGVPLFKCIRGTSALEGFHQKIRQLIRGFNISPRYAIAVLHEFIYRWNHDIDVRIIGLPRKYAQYYDGWEVESEIEITASWSELDEIPHGQWMSTQHFADTGETFGLASNSTALDSALLEAEIDKVVNAIEDGTLNDGSAEAGDMVEDEIVQYQVIPQSAAWVSRELRKERGIGRVRTDTEKRFFADNVMRFYGNASHNEADNYHFVLFSAFAQWWDEIIAEEQAGRRPRTDMTLKNAFHLQEYYKLFKRESNAAATLLPVRHENVQMRREFRGGERSRNSDIPQVAPREPRLKAVPESAGAGQIMEADEEDAMFSFNDNPDDNGLALADEQPCDQEQEPTNSRARVQIFAGRVPDEQDGTLYQAAQPVKAVVPHVSTSRPVSKRRCRKCGHEASAPEWKDFHGGRGLPGSNEYKQPHEVCAVKREDYAGPEFPLADGMLFPRRRKKERNSTVNR